MTRTQTTENSSRFFSSKKAFLTEQPKSNLKSDFYGKYKSEDEDKQSKVCFAESLETVHEIPYHRIFSKADFRSLTLPAIPVHKYVPLTVRDPFAKPVKKKKLDSLFMDDPFKLPFINPDGMAFGFGQTSLGKSRITMNKNPIKGSAVQTNICKGDKGAKVKIGNTVHFRYSDFILRKMDAVSLDKG
jgi:hypothetical protein